MITNLPSVGCKLHFRKPFVHQMRENYAMRVTMESDRPPPTVGGMVAGGSKHFISAKAERVRNTGRNNDSEQRDRRGG
ncbi:hypothetical protein KGM_204266 [Danaus plexippus plexippus]|uniref:Uncharacterized protein n=1 Tax=Danaus plexippus plexippus TaxID=278856 RepID=A0A212EL38_DANPL|nr:hypothetical protein KGM_204266 [Danaus plexippus plexippus]